MSWFFKQIVSMQWFLWELLVCDGFLYILFLLKLFLVWKGVMCMFGGHVKMCEFCGYAFWNLKVYKRKNLSEPSIYNYLWEMEEVKCNGKDTAQNISSKIMYQLNMFQRLQKSVKYALEKTEGTNRNKNTVFIIIHYLTK